MQSNAQEVAIPPQKMRYWPKTELPREKLLARGAQTLSDAELLAVLMKTGTAKRNVLELARAHIEKFGSVRALLNAPRALWKGREGFGDARFAALQAVLELARRHLLEPMEEGELMSSPEVMRKFLLLHLRGLPYEAFCCFFLDNHHRLLTFKELFRGTTQTARIYVREVVREAITYNASAIVAAHNHPSGLLEPSEGDQHITKVMKEALGMIDVRLLDHFIVGDGRCYSFSENGLL